MIATVSVPSMVSSSSQCQMALALGRMTRSTSVSIEADRKSTRLNSSHLVISYAVFCLKKKKNTAEEYVAIVRLVGTHIPVPQTRVHVRVARRVAGRAVVVVSAERHGEDASEAQQRVHR